MLLHLRGGGPCPDLSLSKQCTCKRGTRYVTRGVDVQALRERGATDRIDLCKATQIHRLRGGADHVIRSESIHRLRMADHVICSESIHRLRGGTDYDMDGVDTQNTCTDTHMLRRATAHVTQSESIHRLRGGIDYGMGGFDIQILCTYMHQLRRAAAHVAHSESTQRLRGGIDYGMGGFDIQNLCTDNQFSGVPQHNGYHHARYARVRAHRPKVNREFCMCVCVRM